MSKNIIREHRFEDIRGFEFGVTFWGKPFFTVFLYYIDGILIDTGQKRMRKDILRVLDNFSFSRIILTHHHEDHSGNAAVLKSIQRVPVLAHPETVEKLKRPFKILPYQKVMWGDMTPVECLPLPESIETDKYCLEPIHTPGHSKDHTVFIEERKGWLFTGDLYLGDRIKFFRSDERMAETIESLKKVLTYDFDTILCSHHPRNSGGKEHLRRKLEFLENFHQTVLALHAQGFIETEILKQMDMKEETLMKVLTCGNVSRINMVRSSLLAVQ